MINEDRLWRSSLSPDTTDQEAVILAVVVLVAVGKTLAPRVAINVLRGRPIPIA